MTFIQKHQKQLAESLAANDMPSMPLAITVKAELDEDLMVAFNEAGGHIQSQLVILQLQSNRRLSKLVQLLSPQSSVELSVQGPKGNEDDDEAQ